jgi:hypothetical protein
MSIVTNLDWIEQEKISDTTLLFIRNLPNISNQIQSYISDPIKRILLGIDIRSPIHTNCIETDIRVAKAWIASGKELQVSFVQELEQRAMDNPILHIEAARMHVLTCSKRELTARMALSTQSIPYIYPGEIAPLHIEMFAVGDRALHVLHVEWLKKLSKVAIEAVELDCIHCGAWTLPFLEVLPERELKSRVRKLARKKKLIGGGLGLLAFYGSRIGLDVDLLLKHGDDYDELLYVVAKENERHHLK